MKDKQKSYCHCLSTAEVCSFIRKCFLIFFSSFLQKTGIATESMYNRDLVADLLKLANTVIEETNYDFKVNELFLKLIFDSFVFLEILGSFIEFIVNIIIINWN